MSSSKLFNLAKLLIALSFFGAVGFGIGTYYADYTMNRDLPKDYAFTVTAAFSRYQLALYDLRDVWRDQSHQTDKESANTLKAKQHTKIVVYQSAKDKLEQTLLKAKEVYGTSVTPSIDEFLNWLDKQKIAKIKQLPRYKWSFEYSDKKKPVYNALRKVTGIENIDDKSFAAIMLQVPAAKKALMKNPNDPKRCTVMKQWDKVSTLKAAGRELMAQQIAFMKVGDRYCKAYYHQPSAWGPLYQAKAPANDKHKYDKLSYAEYYHQVVLPLIPEAKKESVQKKYRYFICGPMGTYRRARDPMMDAMLILYKQDKHKFCRGKLYEHHLGSPNDFLNTPASCIINAEMLCPPDVKCDTLQRCLPITKPLFSGQKKDEGRQPSLNTHEAL